MLFNDDILKKNKQKKTLDVLFTNSDNFKTIVMITLVTKQELLKFLLSC